MPEEKVTKVGSGFLKWIESLPGSTRAKTVGTVIVAVAALLFIFFIL